MQLLHWDKELTTPGWPWAAGPAAALATAPLMPENGRVLSEAEEGEGWLDPSRSPQRSAPTPSLPTSFRFAVLSGPSNRIPGDA